MRRSPELKPCQVTGGFTVWRDDAGVPLAYSQGGRRRDPPSAAKQKQERLSARAEMAAIEARAKELGAILGDDDEETEPAE